jgi:hypothetical protein
VHRPDSPPERQSIARASFTNACFMSMIWSSRERNRSCSLVFPRSCQFCLLRAKTKPGARGNRPCGANGAISKSSTPAIVAVPILAGPPIDFDASESQRRH